MRTRNARHPRLLVETSEGRLFEVYDLAADLVAWRSKDSVDVEYDQTSVAKAYRRADAETWEPIGIPALVGLLEHEPGVMFWTKDSAPKYDDMLDDGWEVVK